ncbi:MULTISPECIES: alpha/beta hydrolase-fold protein [unclassified Microbacterium]|uniref:carboxylesterase family protein n=1 Tax=unclassified Microbacterium TaxID=2609290 RepID=UPI000CFC7636|nr:MULTISPECIES: PHB depolymerase family esterase [unclassified Microbacterium]PQZ60986.1 phospholipase [Microbacterium sp. MYb43]PQZ82195.1 phospholipase [Microbacterium sp. MYb40]PRB24104.1 phospholipase [Microbacterium sp. MYb54]PRB30935.1 phospholipase [Microbacterium sp. MYb50]PRB70643.1 phospholipase [Microbacterium sp. MYb24]
MRRSRHITPALRSSDVRDDEQTPADTLRYLIHLPDDYDADPGRLWPVVLFLHGAGERGSDLDLAAVHGPPRLADAGREFPFILVTPQCSESSQWVAELSTLSVLLDEVITAHRIDPARVSVTGLSMGGFGTWSLAVRYPDRFSAIAPICGGLWMQSAAPIRGLPVWAFHGDADDVVPISATEQIVTELRSLDADVRFTRYAGVGHDSWTETYDNPAFYDWLLSHRRNGEDAEGAAR